MSAIPETVGLDFSFTKPAPAAIVQAGYRFVIGYVSPLQATGPNPKDLTAAELAAYIAVGLQVGLVYESGASRALGGSVAGREDGATARARATAIGYPRECVIWWAVDFDATPAMIPTLRAYGEGFAAGWGGAEHGPYGSAAVIDALAPSFRRRWQTAAWSGGRLSVHADVYQRNTHHHPIPAGVPAVAVDENVLCRPAVPFHSRRTAPAPPAPPRPPARPAPAPHPVTPPHKYTVRSGDNLTTIAARYGTTWQHLYESNRATIGHDPDEIRPGMVLRW